MAATDMSSHPPAKGTVDHAVGRADTDGARGGLLGFNRPGTPLLVVLKVGQFRKDLLERPVDHDAGFQVDHLTASLLRRRTAGCLGPPSRCKPPATRR